MRVEVILKPEEERRPRVKIGDIVCWVGREDEPCLVCYKILMNLANPKMTWSFCDGSHEDFIRRVQGMIDCGLLRKIEEIERIVLYPEDKEEEVGYDRD